MANETTATVIGNLTEDPSLRYTAQGVAVASFTVASTPRTFDKASGEYKDGDALFLRCSLWRQPAENLAESDIARGARVIVTGRLRQRSFEKDGQKRSVVELEVDEIGPSLKFATAKVAKAARGSQKPQGSGTPDGDPWPTAPANDDEAPF